MNGKLSILVLYLAFFWVISTLFTQAVFAWSDDAYDYTRIDKHAINTPQEAEGTIESLVDYLIQPARNDKEKLRVIFTWIANNIDYDIESYKSTRARRQVTAEYVFKKRIAVCNGYSILARRMMELATDLEVYRICGYAKGYDYKPGKDIEDCRHCWNAVNLNGKWYFLDCTWGAGGIDDSGKFKHHFNDYYFLTAPEKLIYTHLPDDPVWQRIPNPISKEEFENRVTLKSSYFKYGLQVVSHSESFMETDSILHLYLLVPEGLIVSGCLESEERRWDNRFVFVQKESYRCEIRCVFPKIGEYLLRIFARTTQRFRSPFEEALAYQVRVLSIKNGPIGLPTAYNAFSLKNSYLHCPLDGFLKEGISNLFRITVPNANRVSVVQGKKWQKLKQRGNLFEKKIKLKPGIAKVYARFPGTSKYNGLLEYIVVKNLWTVQRDDTSTPSPSFDTLQVSARDNGTKPERKQQKRLSKATINLKDGNILKGKIISESNKTIVVGTLVGELTVKRSDIESIDREENIKVEIRLIDGTILKGILISETDKEIKLKTSVGEITVPLSKTEATIKQDVGAIKQSTSVRKNKFWETIGIKMVSIPPGSFLMGSNWEDDPDNPYAGKRRSSDEQPVHKVTINAFQMSAHEITQAQYKRVIAINKSHFKENDKHPVEYTDWLDAVIYCNKLSELSGLNPCYNLDTWECDFTKNGFRLPTEAEWEYACRAGTTTKYYTGENKSDLARCAWYYENSRRKTHPVGLKKPNAWGLYDMIGNVWEYCNDWYGPNYYSKMVKNNPKGSKTADYRVARGGSYTTYSSNCRSAGRMRCSPGGGAINMGFRIARSP